MFINVGCYGPDGKRVPTKKRLRELLKENPAQVRFDRTSIFEEGEANFRGDDIPEGVTLSVVLPDPYMDRRSYGSVTRGKDGKPRLS